MSTLVRPDAVKLLSGCTSKKRLFRELGEIAQAAYGLSAASAITALQDRESIGPTGVGDGVALPHGRLADLDRVVGAFVRLEKALPFEAVDGQPVDLIFALFAPVDAGVGHLKALAMVSRSMRDPLFCAKLRSNDDPATLHTILTGIEATKAA